MGVILLLLLLLLLEVIDVWLVSLVVQSIQLQGVYYPEGIKLSPNMNAPSRTVAIIPSPKWDVVRQKSFKDAPKADRQSKTRSMVLTNFR